MNRRGMLLLAGLGASAIPVSGALAVGQGSVKLLIEAPDDIQVLQLPMLDGPVKTNQQLFVLRSLNVERAGVHLALFKEHIAIVERPFNDGRVDAEIANLKQKASNLLSIDKNASRNIDDRNAIYAQLVANGQVPWGSTTTNPPHPNAQTYLSLALGSGAHTKSTAIESSVTTPQSQGVTSSSGTTTTEGTETTEVLNPDYKSTSELSTTFENAANSYIDAQLAADNAERQKADAIDKINLAKAKIVEYEKLLADQKAALTITSHYNGRFTAHVGLGAFVKKGHILGEINT